jgi:uncharacterized SAM-binding protein YcdF (DUF218 family)
MMFIVACRLLIARGLALFFAAFTLLNLAGSHLAAGFDANVWWIDTGFLPHWAANLVLIAGTIGLLCFGIGFPNRPVVRRLAAIAIAALLLVTTWNVAEFYRQWGARRIAPVLPIPLSLPLCAALGLVLWAIIASWKLDNRRQRSLVAMTFAASLFLFPLAQMYCFGKTDYRRPADAIVVFGARTHADGTLSPALFDRTRTAISLYQHHFAQTLIFSGGPGEGAVTEPQAMRKLALSIGVPDSAIILDEMGLNTDMTVANTVPIFDQRHMRTVLAVSHFYHLPRVKLAYTRALAAAHSPVQLLTVPAEEGLPLPRMPFYMAREIAALWAYYLRPLL